MVVQLADLAAVRFAVAMRLAVGVAVRLAPLHREVRAGGVELRPRDDLRDEVGALGARGSGRGSTIEITPEIRTRTATPRITAVVPNQSAICPTTMIGRMLATEISMLSTPNTRPRPSAGMSSWSCTCAEMATIP